MTTLSARLADIAQHLGKHASRLYLGPGDSLRVECDICERVYLVATLGPNGRDYQAGGQIYER